MTSSWSNPKMINNTHNDPNIDKNKCFVLFFKCIFLEAEFKEFETRLKYGWFHLKLFLIFQDLSRRCIETGFWQI